MGKTFKITNAEAYTNYGKISSIIQVGGTPREFLREIIKEIGWEYSHTNTWGNNCHQWVESIEIYPKQLKDGPLKWWLSNTQQMLKVEHTKRRDFTALSVVYTQQQGWHQEPWVDFTHTKIYIKKGVHHRCLTPQEEKLLDI